jgi:hypothetical protein
VNLAPRAPHAFLAVSLVLVLLPWTVIASEVGGPRQPDSLDRPNWLAPITTTVSGTLAVPKERPVTVEYADSPKLTRLLRKSLADAGFHMADADAKGAVLVRVRGVLQLTGKHTARIRIAELAEKGTLVDPDAPRALAPVDIPYVIAVGSWLGRLVDSGQLTPPGGAFLLLDVVGQATGAKDWFNKAVGGDRRGICLINCDNWNKTRQATFHVVEVHDGEGRGRVEIRSELLAEELQPGRVVSAGLTALLDTFSGKLSVPSELPAGEHAKPQD